jgi:hypothetical protein
MCLSLLISAGVLASLLINLGSSFAASNALSWVTPQAPRDGTPSPTPRPSPTPHAVAGNVQAFFQGDPGVGWDSRQQFDLWWSSACSPAALTMVLRAWGAPVRIGQVLDRLIALKAITPQQGLLRANALEAVAKEYQFQAVTFWSWKLQDVARVTSQGVPVLINVVDARRQTPYPAFSVGHWLVVVNVTSDHVEVRDPSAYRIRFLNFSLFHTLFTGVGVVVWRGTSISLP